MIQSGIYKIKQKRINFCHNTAQIFQTNTQRLKINKLITNQPTNNNKNNCCQTAQVNIHIVKITVIESEAAFVNSLPNALFSVQN